MNLDVTRAEQQLNQLIERRALEAEAADKEAAAWAESVRAYNLKRAAASRAEWREHYLRLAGVHERLAEENRQKAVRLVGGA